MIDEEQKRKNARVISRFRAHWTKRGIDFQDYFPCRLRVRYRDHDRKLQTRARLSSGGKVHLLEAEWFNAIDHYSELNPDFQIYELTKQKRALRVHGGASHPPQDKMGGPYIYDIRPRDG
jgi:hypothetical protein